MRTNEQKLRQLILYILENYNNSNLTVTKLQKILYYCDFNYYHKHGNSISGFTYYKNHFGPTIKALPRIIKALEDEGFIKVVKRQNYYGTSQINFSILKRPENPDQQFNDSEKLVVDEVNRSYVGLSPSEISTLSHTDPPYIIAENQSEIEYDNVSYRDDGAPEENEVNVEAQTYFEEAKFDQLFSNL